MSLLVYIPQMDEPGRRLQRIIGDLIWRDSIEIIYTFQQLEFRLYHPSGHEDIALLFASTSKDLNELITSRSLLNHLRIILILPDEERETTTKGHLLRPRFLSYKDGDFSDLALVLQKMKNKPL
jgi:hypothetical protein